MSKSGKELESVVAKIEKLLLGSGYSVKVNEKIFDENGCQIAEFDITLEGTIGSTKFRWLIECRDRPSQGPAPGSWIEQLSGRKNRYQFDKVIAVSTTGFSPSAIEAAKELNVVTRQVSTVQEISDCLGSYEFRVYETKINYVGYSDFDFLSAHDMECAKELLPTIVNPKLRYTDEAEFLDLRDFISREQAGSKAYKCSEEAVMQQIVFNAEGDFELNANGKIFSISRISVPITLEHIFYPATVLTVKSYDENGEVIGEEATIISETNNHIVKNRVLITKESIQLNGANEIIPKNRR